MDDHLTHIPSVPSREDAVLGMAYFAGSGPPGETCQGCALHGYRRQRTSGWDAELQQFTTKTYYYNGCAQFKKLTGRHGPPVAKTNRACKYWQISSTEEKARRGALALTTKSRFE
jgi:hypothetical protein